jgi:hypothetical protein
MDNSRMLSTGMILKSASGRELSPAPRIECTTDGKTRNTLKRVRAWLKKEAIKECEHVKNDFAKQMIEAIDLSNTSPCDISTMNMVLFDKEFEGLSKLA